MTTTAKKNRRAYGAGTLETRTNKQGREVYYGRFRAGGGRTLAALDQLFQRGR